jgi:hypothetical protein
MSLFISYSRVDWSPATRLKECLSAAGYEAIFVDADAHAGIAAGSDWEAELYRALRRASALLVLCSTASLASYWCFAEVSMAKSLGKAIFPVRLCAGADHPLLRDVQAVDLVDDWDAGIRRLLAGLQIAGLDPRDSFEWDSRRSPFPGLSPFEEEDAAVYFGRDAEVRETLDLLNRLRRSGGPRFGVVFGASGSGKSSLLRAGVVPRLRKDPRRWHPIPPIRLGEAPFEDLVRALISAPGPPSRRADWESWVRDELERGSGEGSTSEGLVAIAQRLTLDAQTPEAFVVLVLDQLEHALARGRPRC